MKINSNILYIVHTDLYDKHGFIGGTQLHVKELATSALAEKIYLLYYDEGFLHLTRYVDQIQNLHVKFPVNHSFNPIERTEDYRCIYAMILNVYEIGLVHINHLQNHTLDIVDESQKCNIPVVVTLHDFYMLCPSIYLTDINNQYCAAKIDKQRCEQCLLLKAGMDYKILSSWRTEMKSVFEEAVSIIAPSAYVIEVFMQYYPTEKYQVIAHGQVVKRYPATNYDGTILNIAFIGNMVVHKGSKEAIQIINKCADKDMIFHSFGKIFDEEMNELKAKNFIKHGLYNPGEIQELLHKNQIHVALMLSNCPETFSYTLSEAWQCAIPVISCDIGALGSRINASKAGILINPQNAVEDSISALNLIKKDVRVFEHYSMLSEKAPQQTIESMIEKYINVYVCAAGKRSQKHQYTAAQEFIESMFADVELEKENMEHIRIKNELNDIKNSISYKIVQKFKEIRMPGKEIIKKVIIKLAQMK